MKYWFKRKFWQIKNLIKWFPIIWNQYDWDYGYAIDLFKFQLRKMQNSFNSDKAISSGAKLRASQIKRIVDLMDNVDNEVPFNKIMDEFYNKYGNQDMIFEPTKTGKRKTFELEFVRTKPNYLIPDEEYDELQSETLKKAYEYQTKAEKLVWRLIGENIKSWWD